MVSGPCPHEVPVPLRTCRSRSAHRHERRRDTRVGRPVVGRAGRQGRGDESRRRPAIVAITRSTNHGAEVLLHRCCCIGDAVVLLSTVRIRMVKHGVCACVGSARHAHGASCFFGIGLLISSAILSAPAASRCRKPPGRSPSPTGSPKMFVLGLFLSGLLVLGLFMPAADGSALASKDSKT
jgi:hypothetical protein